MTDSAKPDTEAALLKQAQAQVQQGSLLNAMRTYYEAHELNPASTAILTQLVAINLHLEAYDQAIINLQKLILLEPQTQVNYDQLASVYDRLREWQQASEIYKPLILRRPKLAEAHFNQAFYLRKAGQFAEAIEAYRRALQHGIKQPEEVHLNIAVVLGDDLRREQDAEQELQQALELRQDYLPALYNLANLYEDRGDRGRTVELFRRILAIDPDNAKALARLMPLLDDEPELMARLEKASLSRDIDLTDRVDVLHSLGKIRDAKTDYDKAFDYFEAANVLNTTLIPAYNNAEIDGYFSRIIDVISADWVRKNARDDDEQPIFVCGMFRSGSTLVDQVLGAHPDITTGGERDSVVREFSPPKLRYPEALSDIGAEALQAIAERYKARSRELFPQGGLLTDKRPDNFLYLGALKALFPRAKIVYTLRNPLDNCLSVYFERLGPAMNYAVNLDSIAHYYDQQGRLLAHWQSILGDDLYVVEYEKLITDPKPTVAALLQFLGVSWHDDCLNFHTLKNTVKTASVWQIRQPLYTTSVGRWRNYEARIRPLIEHYAAATEDA